MFNIDSVLASKEWQSFNQRYWQVAPIELQYAPRGASGPKLSVVTYHDGKGRLLLPPYHPHVPVQFEPTPTCAAYRVQRQWLETGQLFVDDMIARGIRGEVTLSPTVDDPRPWIWSHFRVSPRFTYFIDFPFTYAQADRVVRQHANKAIRAGFACEKTNNLQDAMVCLSGSENRRKFTYRMTLPGLDMGQSMLGEEALRVYVAYAPNGEPATARILLHRKGTRACDWIAGTTDKYLNSGATQQLLAFVLEDLATAGASGYDFCGADMQSLACFKLLWGGRLVTQYSIQAYEFRPMKHLLGNMVRYLKRRRAVRKGLAPGRLLNRETTASLRAAKNGDTVGDRNRNHVVEDDSLPA